MAHTVTFCPAKRDLITKKEGTASGFFCEMWNNRIEENNNGDK